MRFWPESFPDVFEIAFHYQRSRQFVDARIRYLQAASLAPGEALETEMLLAAWRCDELAHGRRSELEV